MCSRRASFVGGSFSASAWERTNRCHLSFPMSLVVDLGLYSLQTYSSNSVKIHVGGVVLDPRALKAATTELELFVKMFQQLCFPFPQNFTVLSDQVNAWKPGRLLAMSGPIAS